jgi:hypothetical protein
MSDLHTFLNGALTATSVVAAIFFLRYWHLTRDRFFVLFAAAFLALAGNWAVLASMSPTAEGQHWIYLLRLLAFLLILTAIIDKNRSERG